MNEFNPTDVVLITLSKPYDLWKGYLKKAQKESGYDQEDFIKELGYSIKRFHDQIHVNDWKWISLNPPGTVYNQQTPVHTSFGIVQVNDNDLNYLKSLLDELFPNQMVNQPETKTEPLGFEPTLRQIIIAHEFKVKAGLENRKGPNDWKLDFDDYGRQTYYTLHGKNKKNPDETELKRVIRLLKSYPKAEALAQAALDKL
jgi:hypothetical protein